MFSKPQSVSLLACGAGAGGGGFSTVTCVEACVFNPRESLQVALTVIGPGDMPLVFTMAVEPVPAIVPPVVDQLLTVTGTLSGLVQLQVTVVVPPTSKVAGFAEHDMVGGFLGGSLTVKLAVQVASPPFVLGSEMRAVAV